MKKLLALACLFVATAAPAQQPITWRFDNLATIGNNSVSTVGAPKVIDTNIGKAVHFEGHGDTGDALFFDTLPLTGTLPYTWEVIFRPSSAGAPAQRFFHLQEAGSQSRRLFEIRIVDSKWCLDVFAANYPTGTPPRSAVMLFCDAKHLLPLDQWYAVAAVYDGKILRGYINGVLQAETPVDLLPLGPGGTSVGTRFNKRDFFTGDVFSARFSRSALAVSDLLKIPEHK
jgi:hypothetical protein